MKIKQITNIFRVALPSEPVYSNFDHVLDKQAVKLLVKGEGKVHALHTARNFCGYVWFRNGEYREQVWQYHRPVAEYTNLSIEELIKEVNSDFGPC